MGTETYGIEIERQTPSEAEPSESEEGLRAEVGRFLLSPQIGSEHLLKAANEGSEQAPELTDVRAELAKMGVIAEDIPDPERVKFGMDPHPLHIEHQAFEKAA